MKAFISYSRKDKAIKTRFVKHIKPIADKYGISLWDDSELLPGQDWEKRLWIEFDNSQLVFMLISIEFLSSDFCMTKEFTKAIKNHNKRKTILIPIIIEDCAWKSVPELVGIQVLPGHDKNIKRGFKNQNQALSCVANSIEKLISRNINKKKKRNRSKIAAPKLEDYTKTKFKAVFFDLDGTLVRGRPGHEQFRYSWQLIWAHLGFDDGVRKKFYRDYIDQKISYVEWCEISRGLFRERGLRQADFQKISRKVRLTKNCKKSLKILKDRGLLVNLVSGSINTFLEAVFPECYDYFDNIFINKFQYDHQGIIESIVVTEYDFDGKYDAIKKVCNDAGILTSECVFVGEGHNDKYASLKLSEEGGLSIGYPSDLVFDYVDHNVNKDGLQAVLDVIFMEHSPSQMKLQFPE